jgi:hypothetical protein
VCPPYRNYEDAQRCGEVTTDSGLPTVTGEVALAMWGLSSSKPKQNDLLIGVEHVYGPSGVKPCPKK